MKKKISMMISDFQAKHSDKGITIETEAEPDALFAQISEGVSPGAMMSNVNVSEAIAFYGLGEILDEIGEEKVRAFYNLPIVVKESVQ